MKLQIEIDMDGEAFDNNQPLTEIKYILENAFSFWDFTVTKETLVHDNRQVLIDSNGNTIGVARIIP
jgi:hypothetical protein